MSTMTNDIKDVEKKFLAYLFNNKKYIAAILGKLSIKHFPNYNKIFSLVTSYYSKYKDVITDQMADMMFKKKNLDSATIVEYKTLIAQLRAEKYFNDGEFRALIEQLIEYKKRQDFVKIAEEIVNVNPIECNSSVLKGLEEKVKSSVINATVDPNDVKNEGSIRDSARERFERYKMIKEHPEMLKFVPTGFKHIDDDNGGLRPGELVYVIGRKGDGKSVFLLNLAHNVWEGGYNVIIFSLEIPKEDYERRFDARAAQVNSTGLKMGTLSDAEEKIYEDYLIKQSKGLSADGKQTGTVYIVDTPPGITPSFVDSKVETIQQVLGIKFDMIITDYAGIMQPSTPVAEKRHQQGQIALEQKVIARQRDCIVVSAAQKNRSGSKEKKSDSSFIAESDQIADHIDWGFDIMSVNDDFGVIQTFKTRDAAPINFSFKKQYNMFKITELENSLDSWDQLS